MSKILVIAAGFLAVLFGVWYAFSNRETIQDGGSVPAPAPSTTQDNTYLPSTLGQGRVVFMVKDAVTGSMQEVSAVLITVDKVEVQSATQGWITVSTAQKQYDLLKLKQSGSAALLADVNLPADIYNQIRLNIRTVEVRTSNTMQEAKLPSHTLKIIGNITVGAGKTSTVTIDFLADKSLHLTGNGTFIMAPVVKFESRTGANAEVKADESVAVSGGRVDTERESGMDEKGEMRANFELKGNLDIDASNVIRIKSGTEVQNMINLKY
ncbi:MAG: DUF4382 domain-containing protein [Candidatus Sungbacteria bacterium]|nr:DUF4382 domain-containing protein [Candidatus Sungbacteria bacterium]